MSFDPMTYFQEFILWIYFHESKIMYMYKDIHYSIPYRQETMLSVQKL